MSKFYVDETNSGGYTTVLDCCIENTGRFRWVEIEADSADDAIRQFERHFDVDWNYQNSFEGNSCNCCGRRFTLHTPKGMAHSEYDQYGCLWECTEVPCFIKDGRGGKLCDAPKEKAHA